MTATYNAADEELSRTVDNTGSNLTTTFVRDQRGLVTAETDPAGNTTTIANDQAGQPVVVTGPAVSSQSGQGGVPVTANPVVTTGYDTFGDQVESSDADGNVTTAAYDEDGRQVSVTDPSYIPPGSSTPAGGTTTMAYNNLGEQTKVTDPLGNVTQFSYDQLGDLASQTDPDGGTWTYTYDPAGEQTSVTDPTGAQTQATYDNLGNLITTTELVRQNASAAYTTTYAYNDASEQISQTSPTGVTIKTAYDPLGEVTSSTDGAGNTWTYAYNLYGDAAKVTAPDGTAETASYDLAGRMTALSDLDASGAVLRTESATYDADGNVVSATDFRGNTTTASYDATGMLTSVTQPVSSGKSVTVGYQYDLAGNPTAVTDGNGNTTYATYNSLGLPQTITEPPTTAYNTAANSTTTDIYDGDGDLLTQDLPGGVQVSSTYDSMGDLTGQSGTGAAAPTATRTYTYDTAGRLTAAATSAAGTSGSPGYQPATSETFGYDDRGLLLSASGSAGTSTFTYNASSQLASATDAAGTSSYAYDSAGRLATDADAASGVTGTYSYNTLDQVTRISYGAGNDVQSFGYDTLHRLTSDTLATVGGTQVAAIGYGYDADNNVTSMTTSGLATTGGGTGTVTNTYGYDQANRLTSWTAAPAGGSATTKTYGYDNAGNLTSNNGVTYSYDARDELTSNGTSTYSYAADGDLTSQAGPGGTTTFASDAYGQQITDAPSSYTWDGLGRLISAAQGGSPVALTYDGMTDQVASDSSATYSRDPAGQLVGVDSAAGGKSLALVDQHDDVSGTFTAAGTALASSATWDPWGNPIAATGPSIQLGYQGQWTDPGTGQVDMGARLYKPAAGGFINQDTYTGGQAGPAVGGNLHAYADDNPVSVTDPTGHSPSAGDPGTGSGTVTQAEVDAAAARAEHASQTAQRAEAAAQSAGAAASRAQHVASSALEKARELNDAAAVLAWAASLASAIADAAYKAVQQDMSQMTYWSNQRDAALAAAKGDLEHFGPFGVTAAAYHFGQALGDEYNYQAALAQYNKDLATWEFWDVLASMLWAAYFIVAIQAMVATVSAIEDEVVAAIAQARYRQLAAVAAADEKIAAEDEADYQRLLAEYQQEQQQHKSTRNQDGKSGCGTLLRCLARTVTRTAIHTVKTTVSSVVSNAVDCVTHPNLRSCATTAINIAVAVSTDGTGDIAVDAVENEVVDAAAEDAAADGGTTTAAENGGNAADSGSCLLGAGGQSFTATTKVLLADGKAVPISTLKPGEKVLATNTKTGKTQAETIAAVLVHHDTDLYNLTIGAGGRTAVIDTTSNHPFWVPGAPGHGRWVKAAALRYGTHLRSPSGRAASVAGGWVPPQSAGWMWDLTIPGDHDFYIDTTVVAILVHNCDEPGMPTLHAHYPTQQEALNSALHDAGITDPDLTITDDYTGGRQMLGPHGEPWQHIEGLDDSGEVQQIQLHNGHSFPDGGGFGPHYVNPGTGFHYFWDK